MGESSFAIKKLDEIWMLKMCLEKTKFLMSFVKGANEFFCVSEEQLKMEQFGNAKRILKKIFEQYTFKAFKCQHLMYFQEFSNLVCFRVFKTKMAYQNSKYFDKIKNAAYSMKVLNKVLVEQREERDLLINFLVKYLWVYPHVFPGKGESSEKWFYPKNFKENFFKKSKRIHYVINYIDSLSMFFHIGQYEEMMTHCMKSN